MQSVNVLPNFTSQDADLNVKGALGTSTKGQGDAAFSTLVEQHLQPQKDDYENVSVDTKVNNETAIKGNTVPEDGNTRTKEPLHADGKEQSIPSQDERQKTDSSATSDDVHSALTVDEVVSEDSETLSESEQFISLLYTSDNTLTAVDKKSMPTNKQSIEVPVEAQLAKNQQSKVEQVNNVINDSVVNDPTVNTTTDIDTSSIEESLENSDHKLKAFSKDELLTSMQLKNNVAGQQSSEQVLKDYQMSLQAKQGLVNGDITTENNTDIDTGLSQTEIDVVTKASVSHHGKVIDSALAENKPTTVTASNIDATLADDQLNVASNDIKLQSSLTSEQGDESIDITPNSSVNSQVSNVLTNSSSNSAIDTGINTNAINSTQAVIDNVEHNNLNNVLNTKESKPVDIAQTTQPLQEQSLDKKTAQTMVNVNNKAAESIDINSGDIVPDEAILDEAALLVQDKPKLSDTTVNGKVVDGVLMRSVAESHAQAIQDNQEKQTNDAYIEHETSEVLNHNVATDTAKIQKNNVLLQQETISIFKKDFSEAVKDKVMLSINQKIQQFDITLDPPEFGNMQVRVNLQGEQASVNFVVQNQQAKEALEQNMFKLREMMAEQGVDVGGANVEQQDQQSANGGDASNSDQHGALSSKQDENDSVQHVLSANLFDSSASGVDYYA